MYKILLRHPELPLLPQSLCLKKVVIRVQLGRLTQMWLSKPELKRFGGLPDTLRWQKASPYDPDYARVEPYSLVAEFTGTGSNSCGVE